MITPEQRVCFAKLRPDLEAFSSWTGAGCVLWDQSQVMAGWSEDFPSDGRGGYQAEVDQDAPTQMTVKPGPPCCLKVGRQICPLCPHLNSSLLDKPARLRCLDQSLIWGKGLPKNGQMSSQLSSYLEWVANLSQPTTQTKSVTKFHQPWWQMGLRMWRFF